MLQGGTSAWGGTQRGADGSLPGSHPFVSRGRGSLVSPGGGGGGSTSALGSSRGGSILGSSPGGWGRGGGPSVGGPSRGSSQCGGSPGSGGGLTAPPHRGDGGVGSSLEGSPSLAGARGSSRHGGGPGPAIRGLASLSSSWGTRGGGPSVGGGSGARGSSAWGGRCGPALGSSLDGGDRPSLGGMHSSSGDCGVHLGGGSTANTAAWRVCSYCQVSYSHCSYACTFSSMHTCICTCQTCKLEHLFFPFFVKFVTI